MNRRELRQAVRHLIVIVLALMIVQSGSYAASPASRYASCAKACLACSEACRACNQHCAEMVKNGMKEHELSMRLSADCRDVCALAAKLCARNGPMAPEVCKACARACTACGTECGKYKTMAPMAACAKTCAACRKACEEMIKTGK